MTTALEKLALADDYTVIRAIEHLSIGLFEDVGTDFSDLIKTSAIDGKPLLSEEDIKLLVQSDSEELTAGNSVVVARKLMFLLARNTHLSELVSEALVNWNDDRKKVGLILAGGLVASLLMLIASTEFEYKGENFYFRKEVVDYEQIRAVADILNCRSLDLI